MKYLTYALSDEYLLYLLLQLGVAITFLITAYRAWRNSPSRLVELLTAVVFGLLLEEGDILIFGTYSYNQHWVSVGYVPIAIALTWAMIIASAMNLTDALGLGLGSGDESGSRRKPWDRLLRTAAASMADAVWAIILDLSLDAVAIRVGLWRWNIRFDQGWFGVPWGNFYSWLFVAAMFSLFTRIVRNRTTLKGPQEIKWQLAVPFMAYGGLLASLIPFIAIQVTVFAADKQNTWPIFLITLLGFLAATVFALSDKERRPREAPDNWLVGVRALMHATFLATLLVSGIFLRLPILLAVALAMLAVEFAVVRFLKADHGSRVLAQGLLSMAGESRAE